MLDSTALVEPFLVILLSQNRMDRYVHKGSTVLKVQAFQNHAPLEPTLHYLVTTCLVTVDHVTLGNTVLNKALQITLDYVPQGIIV